MAKEEKNYEPIIFMNTPIMNKNDDVIGISSSVDAINIALEDGAKMVGVVAEYGTGKSSLTEMLIKSKPKKKEIRINMWEALDNKSDDEDNDSLTKTFIYQLAKGIGQGVANHVNKILSRNYGIISFSIGLKRFWFCLIMALLSASSYFILDGINIENYIPIWSIKQETVYTLKVFSPVLILVSIILIAIGLIGTNVAFSKWKDENSRITEINELFYAYSYVYKLLLSIKKQKIIVIEDLDRIENKDIVISFLKELYRFNNLFNQKSTRKEPAFIVSIAPECLLGKIQSDIKAEDNDNEDKISKQSKRINMYSKVFDYVIELKPIHYDDYEIVLRDIINSEPDKKRQLNKLLERESENDTLPKEFKWIYKGENLTIREIKDRLNKAIALYIDLKNKKYISNPYINLEACCAVTYLEAEYTEEFYLITHEERGFSQIIQESYSKEITADIIADELGTKEINEELAIMIKNRILDIDFKMYFYSFPKGSYIKNIDEKQLCNYIELPDENEYTVEELEGQVERIYKSNKEKTLNDSIKKVYRRGQLFPKVIFENSRLFNLALQCDSENLVKSLDSIMKYSGDVINREDIRLLTNVKQYCIDQIDFLRRFVDSIVSQSDKLSVEEIIDRRILLIYIFIDDIDFIRNMFINADVQLPIIEEREIKEINNVNKAIKLVDMSYIDSENYVYIQDMLVEDVFIESNIENAVDIQEAIMEVVDFENIADGVYNFINKNKIVRDTIFTVLADYVIAGNFERKKIVEYVNSLPVERLTDLYYELINRLMISEGLNDEIIIQLAEKKLYETPLLHYCESDKLQKINFNDEENAGSIISACENINNMDVYYVPNIRSEIIEQNNGLFPKFYEELYSDKYELICNQEIFQMAKFEYGIKWLSGNRITETNLDRVLECINSYKREGRDCYIIFEYLFNNEYDDACVDNVMIEKIVYGLDYKKVLFDSMTKEQISEVVEMLTVPLNLNIAEEAKKFMLLVNCLDEELEKIVFTKLNTDEYIDLINQLNTYSKYTIQNIKALTPSYPLNSNIRDKLLEDECYEYYIVGKILYENKFEFPMEGVPFEKIILLYREESEILNYLISNDDFIEYVYNKNMFCYMGKCNFDMVRPFQKFKQTFDVVEFVLVCLESDEDIEKYLLELNEISDSDSSVRISRLLIEKQYIQYLRRDDVFEHVKLRLWEIVSKNKGYKGSFTRKRNEFVKNPVIVKNPHSNIKYPYVK